MSRSRPKKDMMYSPKASPAVMMNSEKTNRFLFMGGPR
jgi:hypothetical protein